MIIIRARYVTSADEVPAFALLAPPPVYRLQFSGTMPRVTGLLAATCTPARTRDTKRERYRMRTLRHCIVAIVSSTRLCLSYGSPGRR